MIATLTLNPSIDQHLRVKRLIPEDTNRAFETTFTPGGKGANVSKVVRELGGDTRAYALLGGSVGQWWEKLAAAVDLPYQAVPISGETRINITLTDSGRGIETKINSPGPEISRKDWRRLLRLLGRIRPVPSYWVLAGSLCPGLAGNSYEELIALLQTQGARCVLDADGESLKRGLRSVPFLIKPNQYEFARLTGKSFKSLHDYLPPAERLVESGVEHVVISLAEKGALFVGREGAFHAVGPQVKVLSKVGAGDSLVGGYLYALARRQSRQEAARLAIAASLSTVQSQASRLCHRSQISGLARQVRIKPV